MANLVKTVGIVAGIVFLLLGLGFGYQRFATNLEEKQYQPVGKMIDIGGYKLHMIDSKVGKATVVIDSGAGGKTLDWCLVQPEIAKFARVITYDRAGYAWSDVSPLLRTSENIVQELRTMLHNAKIPAPYILVGHSFGGLNVRLFAAQYPDEVAGVILIDSAHEDLFEKMPQLRPNKYFLECVNIASRCGIFRVLNLLPFVSNKADAAIEKYPEFLRRICLAQNLSTKYMNTLMQEGLCSQESYKQIKQNCGQLDDKPLTVISSAQPWPGQENVALNKQWAAWQADLVTKSSRGKQIIVENSGHNISYDQPEVIIDAVRQMTLELQSAK